MPTNEGSLLKSPSGMLARTLLLAALCLTTGCKTASPTHPSPSAAGPAALSGRYSGYNLILISLANTSAQRMSLYGYRRKTTPKLDEWARGAWVFENAFTHASWTLPVGTSLFTGMYPYSHKIQVRNTRNVLDPDIRTLPETLRDAGYRTAAFTGGLDYFGGFSHMRGFEQVPDNPNYTGFRTTLAQANAWLSRNADRKFMVFIHGYDTHCPFIPAPGFAGAFSGKKGKNVTVISERCVRGEQTGPDEFHARYSGRCTDFRKESRDCDAWQETDVRLTRDDIRYLSDLYDDKILEVDSLVGDFLSSLGDAVIEKTIIAIVSDHGEMFAKHGRFGRAGTVRGTHYEDVLHVPLLIRLPGEPGRRISGLAQLIDVLPTISEAFGTAVSTQTQGRSLVPLATSGTSVNEFVFAGAHYIFVQPKMFLPEEKRFVQRSITDSIRDRRWKLIREVKLAPAAQQKDGRLKPASESVELYDLENDPDELRDLAEARPETTQRLLKRLARWAEESRSINPETPRTREIPESLLRQARDRGYW